MAKKAKPAGKKAARKGDTLDAGMHYLRQCSRLYEAAFTLSYDAQIVIDERSTIVEYNAAAKRMFGHDAKDVIGKSLEMLIPGDLRAAHYEGMRRFIETGVSALGRRGRAYRTRALHADGHEFHIAISVAPVRLNGGEFLFTSVIRDITAEIEDYERRKREMTIIARLYAEYRTTVEHAPVAFYEAIVEPDGRVTNISFITPYIEVLTGYAPDEWNTELWRDVLHPDDRGQALADRAQFFGARESTRSIQRWIRRDGRVVTIELWRHAQVERVKDADGKEREEIRLMYGSIARYEGEQE